MTEDKVRDHGVVVGGDGASLEEIADGLLRDAGAARDTDCPAYSEAYLAARSRRRREISIEDLASETNCEPVWVTTSYELTAPEIVDAAVFVGLPSEHLEILILRQTMTMREIALETHKSLAEVSEILVSSLRQISNAPQFGLVSMLAEVFHMPASVIKYLLSVN